MRLMRVQVPEFRVLKNVDISFEPEYVPQVFPLGSLNGGGKSTLLQLIFVLLHCSAHQERHQFISNMLEHIGIPEGEISKRLAKFELLDGDEKIELEFTLCNDAYLRQLDIDPIFNKDMVSFDIFIKENELLSERTSLKDKLKQRFFSDILHGNEVVLTAEEQAESIEHDIEAIDKKIKINQPLISNISENLILKKQCHITTYACNGRAIGLLCHSSGLRKLVNDVKDTLTAASKKVFLTAPATQVYLFLNNTAKKSLFKKLNDKKSWSWRGAYDAKLNEAKKNLPNFLTYDIFAIDAVVALIEEARNQDFKALADTGTSGNSYQIIIEELNLLTLDKKIRLQFDENATIIGINFQTNDGIDIYPEDLSHGELKRLSIYVWLKFLSKDENIVLMDEIESGFHPDWQRHIVDDLVEWEASNQYILATHSYELCRGITPAHVKELPPNLLS
ncbi:MAG: AAA family ATPase [Methylobacter sp.]|nr:AAA family ATPase [Methylobacter sp.]